MHTKLTFAWVLMSIFTLSIFNSCRRDVVQYPDPKPDIAFYALGTGNTITKYNAMDVQTVLSGVTITGLQAGETIMAIDFRPATGQLYGLGSTSRLYVINHMTGKASAVSATPFTPAISGTEVGFDFNPTVDRIRLVTSSGQNLRLNPETGAVVATDMNINPGSPSIVSVAYTNSMAGASATTLYDIDVQSGKLYKQDPPNNGALVEVGSIDIDFSGEGGFDISADNSVALASLVVGGKQALYQIDLDNGYGTNLGYFANGVIGIAIPTMPVAYAVDMMNNLQIFNFDKGATPVSKPITGLQMGENLLAIDMRPATGQLYGLGSSSRLYTINMSSGVATMVGSFPFAAPLIGTSFGFDFNPTVDRIRVVSNTGQNMRLNPNDGSVAVVDLSLNPGIPKISAAAYSNNFAGATSTVLYDLDPSTDKLYKQSPPNDGTLIEIGNLGIDIQTENGFDIGGTSDMAYAVLTSGGVTNVYMINTTTGAATVVSDFSNSVVGFAVGLGF